MKDKKYLVKPDAAGNLNILEGQYRHKDLPKNYEVSGLLQDPMNFYHRFIGEQADEKTIAMWEEHGTLSPVVEFDYNARTITLINDIHLTNGRHKITGRMNLVPWIERLKINEEVRWDKNELQGKIKWAKDLFTNVNEYGDLYKKLEDFQAKLNVILEDKDEKRGQSTKNRIVELEHSIPLQFTLSSELYIGGGKKTFQVNVMIHTDTNSPKFSLESIEMHSMLLEAFQSAVEQTKAVCTKAAFIHK